LALAAAKVAAHAVENGFVVFWEGVDNRGCAV
jgi:hypothetical protein